MENEDKNATTKIDTEAELRELRAQLERKQCVIDGLNSVLERKTGMIEGLKFALRCNGVSGGDV